MASRWARGRWPWRTVWYADPGFQRRIDEAAAGTRFDVVAVEDSSMSVFRYPAGAATVYTHHEVLRPRPVDWAAGPPREWPGWAFREVDWRRWQSFQPYAWSRFDRVQVFSRRDAEAIAELAPEVSGRIRVDPFGIVMPPTADLSREEPETVVFVGNFEHPPNRDAALWLAGEIMPLLWRERPAARLRLVGTAPPPAVLALAGERVDVVADAARVEPHLEAASVVLAPVRTGGGMRMKVLQAMAMGKAVVTTGRGTEGYTGFDEAPPLEVADGQAEIAAATAALLIAPDRRRKLGEAARRFAERHHDPGAWGERLTAVYEEAVAGRRVPL